MLNISRIHPVLGRLLSDLEKIYQVEITDGARTIQEHIDIYKKLYPKDWFDKVPFGSRHLPVWDTIYLRAVDLKLRLNGITLTGYEAKNAIELIKPKDIFFGYGIGDFYLHVDCDRTKPTEWRY